MSAQIISMDAARKARQRARDDRAAVFLLPVHVAAFFVETWLDALEYAAQHATAPTIIMQVEED